MSNFEGIQLTQDEERLFTDILLSVIEHDVTPPVSNADLLHELCRRAEAYSKIKTLNVDLRKKIMSAKAEIESGEKQRQEKGLIFLDLISCFADIFDNKTALLYQKINEEQAVKEMMHLPFAKRKIDFHKLADAIVNSPSAKEQIQEELWAASNHRNVSNEYLPTKPIKTNYHPSSTINIDILYDAEGRVRPFGQDDIVLTLHLQIYENNFLIGSRICKLYYDTPESDYTEFDITLAHDNSEISQEGLKVINNLCKQLSLVRDNSNEKELHER